MQSRWNRSAFERACTLLDMLEPSHPAIQRTLATLAELSAAISARTTDGADLERRYQRAVSGCRSLTYQLRDRRPAGALQSDGGGR